MGLPTEQNRTINHEAIAINFRNFFSGGGRRLLGSRVRLCDRTCGQIRGCVAHTRVNGWRAGGCVSSQRRALSNVNQNDGLSSFGGRGAKTYLTALRMENRRFAVSQSRGGQQQG